LLQLVLSADAERSERAILRMTSGHTARTEAVVAAWIGFRREHGVSRCNALRQLVAAARFRAPPVRPIERILILASTRDALVDVRCSRSLARAWQCPLFEHPDAGHDLPLDDAPWVVERIGAWLTADGAITTS
jgi:pimeloyl-ACP methyl ester carboxylesterase